MRTPEGVSYPVADETGDGERTQLASSVDAAIDQLDNAGSNWSALTPAQRTAAMGLAVQTVARVSRLLIGRVDS